ncbi:MAG: hypothetical protein HXL66_04455, partial [Capnocytophaga sp.]|nr:hypothetical protein [Capnocytophaga sp.]
DCWFNHKELVAILPSLQKIGSIQLKPYSLWTLSPANSIEEIYEEITMDKKHFGGKLKKVEELVEKVIEEII